MPIKEKLGKKAKTINKGMLAELTRELSSKLNKISDSEAKSLSHEPITGDFRIISRKEGKFHFNHEACAHLKDAIKLIKNDPLYNDVSEKKIEAGYEDLTIHLLLENVTSDVEINAMVDAFLSKLRKSVKEHRVMMPIEQLDLSDLTEVKIGNVRLYSV